MPFRQNKKKKTSRNIQRNKKLEMYFMFVYSGKKISETCIYSVLERTLCNEQKKNHSIFLAKFWSKGN